MNEQAKAIIKMIREAGYVTVGEGVDKKDVSLTHDQVEGLAKRILTEQLGECEPFERVSLENVLRADADGMPVFRECFEHETLMSFYDDDGNEKFIEWWEVEGKYLFGKYYGTEPAPQDDKFPHDHMCPCGEDWLTYNQIAKRKIKEYVKQFYENDNDGMIRRGKRTTSIGDLVRWLDKEGE